ncbi:MAG: tRNA epoxyqueuosine(34) reductase QueG [Acidobacteriota bacterium]
MDKAALTARVKAEALQASFDAVGVAAAGPVPGATFDEWLARGYHGTMAYLERNRERRLDPRQILPGARSVLCVALDYGSRHRDDFQDPAVGRVARYARGRDYHRVMGRRLKRLWRRLATLLPDCRARWFVDTGPVLEKYWAWRAGLGWPGKHTNLLSRDRGSWFFLGVMFLTAELEPDEPSADFCGTCRRCIEACPTQAIVEPYVLDARRCISYLTIELREAIPEGLRSGMGNWVFGCDICQEVCPWNRRAPEEGDPAFAEVPRDYRLSRLAGLSSQEFDREFQGSAVRRAKWSGFLRNVAVALGNSGRPEARPLLTRLVRSGPDLVREHAAWALAKWKRQ